MTVVLAPVIAVLAVASVALWVLTDARRWQRSGTPVVFRAGSFTMTTPESWALACLLMFVFFVPIYVAARRN